MALISFPKYFSKNICKIFFKKNLAPQSISLMNVIVTSSVEQWQQNQWWGAIVLFPTHCIFCNNTYSCSIVITIQWLLDCLLSFVCSDFYIVLNIFVDLGLFSFSFHTTFKSFLWRVLKAFTIGWWKFLYPHNAKEI